MVLIIVVFPGYASGATGGYGARMQGTFWLQGATESHISSALLRHAINSPKCTFMHTGPDQHHTTLVFCSYKVNKVIAAGSVLQLLVGYQPSTPSVTPTVKLIGISAEWMSL